MHTAIYVRVSSEEQAKSGYSIDAQKSNIEKFCKSNNINNFVFYIDEGYSGAKYERPALQELLSAIKDKEVERIVVWRIDRLSRKMSHLIKILEICESNNVIVNSMTESFDANTPVGKLLVNMLGSIAEFERESIIQRIEAVKETRKKKKRLPLGNPPLGIKVENDRFVQDENAFVIKKIFEMYLDGYKSKKIAKELNIKGYRTGANKEFTRASVWKIVKNPTYAGLIEIDGVLVEGNIDPIVDRETFYRVQEIINSNRYDKKKPAMKHILTGIIYCGLCGAGLHTAGTGKKRNYRCATRICYDVSKCDLPGLNADFAENEVYRKIFKIISSNLDEFIKPLTEKYEELKAESMGDRKQIKILKNKRSEIKANIDKYLSLFESGEMHFDSIRERLSSLEKRVSELDEEIANLEKKVGSETSYEELKENILFIMKNFRSLWNVADNNEKRNLIQSIIERINVYSDCFIIYFKTGYEEKVFINKKPAYINRNLEEWEIKVLENLPTNRAKAMLMIFRDHMSMIEAAYKLQVDFSKIQHLVHQFSQYGVKCCMTEFKENMKIEFEDYLLEHIDEFKQLTFAEIQEKLKSMGYDVSSNKVKNFWYRHFPRKD